MVETAINRIDYTHRDYDSIVERCLSHLQSMGLDHLINDYSSEQFIRMIIELVAYISDRDAWTLDYHYNELRYDAATERSSYISFGKLVGYQLQASVAATVDVECTTDVYDTTLYLSKGAQVEFASLPFTIIQDYEIPGDLSFEISLIQGTQHIDSFDTDGTEKFTVTSSRNKAAQNYTPEVRIDTELWEEVDFLVNYGEGKYYELRYLDDSSIQIIFGDGTHGNKVPVGGVCTVTYLVCSEDDGNAFSIGDIVGKAYGEDDSAAVIEVQFENAEAPSGGDSPEDALSARERIAPSVSRQDNLVTPGDYVSYAASYPGILSASIETDPAGKIAKIYLLGEGYAAPSQATLDAIQSEMAERRAEGWSVQLLETTNVFLDITANIHSLSNYDLSAVETQMSQAIYNLFEPAIEAELQRGVGDPIYLSDIFRFLDSQYGVEYVDIIKMSLAPVFDTSNWTAASTPSDFEVFETQTEEVEWSLVYVQISDNFTVLRNGIPETGGSAEIGILYVSDDAEVHFTMPAQTYQPGDVLKVRTKAYNANIQPAEAEFVRVGSLNLTHGYV
ncbi:hypothetical protein DRO66_01860 [Candidatus Bathyarchaeota archaeon]|nr:MAG: hypothetical protein DRO66_01860 [Candidatus Bathyarchaeota archaeon]